MEVYYGTKRILAAPQDKNLEPGYVVEYQDGYRSWSPKEAFENAYRKNGQLNFGHALEAVKTGNKISRSGWNGKGLYVYMWRDTLNRKWINDSAVPLSYLCLRYPCGDVYETGAFVPWVPTQTDLLAEDWCIVS